MDNGLCFYGAVVLDLEQTKQCQLLLAAAFYWFSVIIKKPYLCKKLH